MRKDVKGYISGYILSDIIDYYHYKLYNRNISNEFKYNIVICIAFLGFLTGYTSNDLVTNMIILSSNN